MTATAGMCYLLAYFEEWEGFDFAILREGLLEVVSRSSPPLTPEQVAALASAGLLSGFGSFAPLQALVTSHAAMGRIDATSEPMFAGAISIAKLKRRHLDDFTFTWNIARGIGLGVGIVDRAGLVPGIAPERLPT